MRDAIPISTPPSLGEVSSVAEESTGSCATTVSDSQEIDDPGQTEAMIRDEPVVLSCDASSQTKGSVGCARLREEVRRWGNKFITLKGKFEKVTKQPAKIPSVSLFQFCGHVCLFQINSLSIFVEIFSNFFW